MTVFFLKKISVWNKLEFVLGKFINTPLYISMSWIWLSGWYFKENHKASGHPGKCMVLGIREGPWHCWASWLLRTLVSSSKRRELGTSLVAQWLRIRLPVQGTWFRALVREDPTCRRAAKPMCHNYWAHVLQLLKPACLEPVLCNKRNHCNEKHMHCNEE